MISCGNGGSVSAVPSWTGPARMIRAEFEYWTTDEWRRHKTECEISISSNGSHAARCQFATYHHLLLPNSRKSFRILFLQPQGTEVEIDDAKRTVSTGLRFQWRSPPPAATNDADCGNRALMISTAVNWDDENKSQLRFAGRGNVAGYDVVRYVQSGSDSGAQMLFEISLAPSLSCELMEATRKTSGWLGVTKSVARYRVTHHERGEPDPSLMMVPSGYSVKER
jgi:hypothetical protein